MSAQNMDRLTCAQRPNRQLAGYHRWSELLFLHWSVPVEMIRPLIPAVLELDTWNEEAWIGVVPFFMGGVRPYWAPAVPGISNFCETNVRTYVHFRGGDPGVWFFSLDASRRLAVALARRYWNLPYHFARMSLRRTTESCEYHSARVGTPGCFDCRIHWTDEPPPGTVHGRAVPGTLEHFLIERYLLYAWHPAGRLYTGQVHHTPYPLQSVILDHLEQDLTTAAGISVTGPPRHAIYSPGVSVEVFPLQAVSR